MLGDSSKLTKFRTLLKANLEKGIYVGVIADHLDELEVNEFEWCLIESMPDGVAGSKNDGNFTDRCSKLSADERADRIQEANDIAKKLFDSGGLGKIITNDNIKEFIKDTKISYASGQCRCGRVGRLASRKCWICIGFPCVGKCARCELDNVINAKGFCPRCLSNVNKYIALGKPAPP